MDVNQFIPVKSIVGPGSQEDDFADGQLSYMNMPSSMDTYDQPLLPEPDEVGDIKQALNLLTELKAEMSAFNESKFARFKLSDLAPHCLDMINQALGVGEVSATVKLTHSLSPSSSEDTQTIEVQESVMAGLWRIRELSKSGTLLDDYLQVALIPEVLLKESFKHALDGVDCDLPKDTVGTINSPSILVELNESGLSYKKGNEAKVINLSLLPVSEKDIMELGQRLGVGPTTILSRGYGNCRIGATHCKNIWWIKYYNSDDSLILNIIEVSDMPEVAKASLEDIQDSAERLGEILDIYL